MAGVAKSVLNRHSTPFPPHAPPRHTELNRWAPWALRAAFFPLSWALLQTPQQGARPIVFLAASERVEGRGGGFWATSRDKQQPFEVT